MAEATGEEAYISIPKIQVSKFGNYNYRNHQLPCRSKLKQQANHRHEQEKDFMVTLQAVGVATSFYSTDTALDVDDMDRYASNDEPDNPITFINPATGPTVETGKPLLFIYDCETTGGSHLRDHVMEIGSVVSIPDGVSISNTEFSSLCHTSQHITRQGSFLFL